MGQAECGTLEYAMTMAPCKRVKHKSMIVGPLTAGYRGDSNLDDLAT